MTGNKGRKGLFNWQTTVDDELILGHTA